MTLIFLGTPSFAVPSLERAAFEGHQILAVFTQPDRPKGRGQAPQAPPVKQAALKLGLPVFQPERIRHPEVVEHLRALAPQAMVVVGYGQIIPAAILEIPPLGIVNVHASLLPKYRGAAPIQWAIARGERRTGVTTMRLDAGLDTGPILLRWETLIGEEETAPELSDRLALAGADLLAETLSDLPHLDPQPQDPSQATYAPILKKDDGHIQWSMPAQDILNRVRGFLPWPGCYTFIRGRRLHVWRGKSAGLAGTAPFGRGSVGELSPGALRANDGRLYAGCGDGAIELLEVQLEGKKRMDSAAFLNGFAIEADEALA
jgi:methionyl-tRNA formyltransferase